MVANAHQKMKFKNSHGKNFLMIPQSSDKTWECPPQIAAPGDKKRCPVPPPPLTTTDETLRVISP